MRRPGPGALGETPSPRDNGRKKHVAPKSGEVYALAISLFHRKLGEGDLPVRAAAGAGETRH